MKKYLVILIAAFCISCSGNNKEPFTFVQLCDPQLGMGGYEHDMESLRQAVKQINELDPDFVVVCGDLVHHPNDSSYNDLLKITRKLNMKCYPVPGNHDVGNVPNDTTLAYYRKTIGKDYYDFNYNGYLFMMTDTQLWKVDVKNESEKQDRWFKETLKNQEADHKPVIVVGHIPLYLESPDEEEEYSNLPADKRTELLALFRQYNVKAFLTGHTHRTIIHNYENIQLVSGETTSKNFDHRQFGFRLWKVSPDTVIQQFVPLDTTAVVKSVTIIK